jgi:flagellar FliL protein
MATNTAEKTPAAAPSPGDADKEPLPENASSPSSGGGFKAWLPLIVTVVTMPALAYVTTAFVLLPKMQKAMKAATETPATADAHGAEAKPAATETHSAPKAGEKPKDKSKDKESIDATLKERGVKVASNGKTSVPLNKILVNIAGSMGSRYLLASVTLASDKEDFGETVLSNEAQLLDLGAGVLASRSIGDLEKPGARNIIRAELLTVFNNALGAGTVQDLYLTEFAIQ